MGGALTTATLARPRGKPRSRFYEIAHRIAARFEPPVAAAFLAAVTRFRDTIDLRQLEAALAGGDLSVIEAAAGSGRLGAILLGADDLRDALEATAAGTGEAGMRLLEDITGLDASFNRVDPNVVLYAREQTAILVVAVGEDIKEAIRIVTAAGADLGLTIPQQARAIRELVGLRPSHALAPERLAQEIRAGQAAAATARRLSAADKAAIRSRITRGTVTEEFVEEMRGRYTASLLNRRALDIARTETLDAAHSGQREAWRQAVVQGVLPATARRVPIVTPDDRLRETHARVPGMNPGGVALGEPFQTPWGPRMGPPYEPNCRCGEGLIFPGQDGVL